MKYFIFFLMATIALTAYASSGEDIFYKKCTSCHGSSLSLNKSKSPQQWVGTIERMKKHGLSISKSETKSIASFLTGGK